MTDPVAGAVRIVAGFDSAYLEETLNKATRKAKEGGSKIKGAFAKGFHGFSDELRGELDGIAGQVPILGGQVTALGGMFGAVAVGGLAAFTLGLAKANEAMQWGDALSENAALIGVTAEALQEYHYMADEAGVSIEDMDASLKTLNGTLGAMKTGIGDAKLKKVFEALGITRADLMPLRDASELLPILADKISQLGTQAEQAQVANKLGIGPLLPLLQQGAGAMERMAQEARDMGLIISNETVAALSDAQRKAEKASQVIDTQLRVAFANLAPMITGATENLAGFTKGLNDALTKYNEFNNKKGIFDNKVWYAKKFLEEGVGMGLSGQALREYKNRRLEQMAAGGDDPYAREDSRSAKAEAAGYQPPKDGLPKNPPDTASELDKKSGTSKTLTDAEKEAQRLARMKAIQGQMDTLNRAYDGGKLSAENYAVAMDRLDQAYGKLAGDIRQNAGLSNDLMLDGSMESFRTLAQLFQGVSAATAEVNNQLELTPGFIDPIIQKQDQVKGIVSDVAADLIYGFAQASDDAESMGDVVLGVLRKWLIQWGIMKAAGFLGLDLQNGGLKSGGRLDKVVTSILDKIPSFRDGRKDVGSSASLLDKLPGYATGTLRAPGGLSWVGEKGPELVNLPRGAQVFPADVSRAMTQADGALRVQVVKGDLFDVIVDRRAGNVARRQLPGQMGALNKLGTTRA